MSAYIVNDETIDVIVKAFEIYNVDYKAENYSRPIQIIANLKELRDGIGQSLLDQNYKSVNYRYRENTDTPKYCYTDLNIISNGTVDTGLIYGCIDCYEYQACETDDYFQSKIHNSLTRLKNAMLLRYINQDGHEIKYGYER